MAAYVIDDGVEWETGIGIVTSATVNKLSRDTVLESSNSGALVNWTNDNALTRTVSCMALAQRTTPTTTRGDFLRTSADGTIERIARGSTGQRPSSNGNDLVFALPGPELPGGTIMFFQQSTAPVGWVKEATHNDKSLRVVSGSVSPGGATALATVFGSGKSSGSYTLLEADAPLTVEISKPSA